MAAKATVGARRIRVAVVDDHRLVLDGITASLRSHKQMHVVASEPTWVGLLAHEEFPVDVVVIDLHLTDNISIGTKLRALSAAGSRAIVMSRHSDAKSIYTAIHAGAKGFVPKSEAPDELIKAIVCAADDRQYQNAPVREAMIALAGVSHPTLGDREQRALILYSAGRSVREVATMMDATEDTIKSYVKRARQKYKKAGIDLGTKLLLRQQGLAEGWLSPE